MRYLKVTAPHLDYHMIICCDTDKEFEELMKEIIKTNPDLDGIEEIDEPERNLQ